MTPFESVNEHFNVRMLFKDLNDYKLNGSTCTSFHLCKVTRHTCYTCRRGYFEIKAFDKLIFFLKIMDCVHRINPRVPAMIDMLLCHLNCAENKVHFKILPTALFNIYSIHAVWGLLTFAVLI
ncbi:hypothetical protein KUTeg_011303 [Tegillarca granosa]|uniref:Uncharacterized protein n=1 Tax=Tegillarca granosa TaxID=220873 RepID=A0ABQ9F153_TEGGR|nr:hypothetical protein KUTeg_011303 [Tegillarca granosa]